MHVDFCEVGLLMWFQSRLVRRRGRVLLAGFRFVLCEGGSAVDMEMLTFLVA